MSDSPQLKLVILYDGGENRYMVCDHNLTPEEADEEVERCRQDPLPAFAVNQRRRHRATDAQNCRVCRDDVKRSSGLVPKPKFKRRKP